MTLEGFHLTRRKFMLLTAATLTTPLLLEQPGFRLKQGSQGVVMAAEKHNADFDIPGCKGCRVCMIFYSNCLAVNNRLCWCEYADVEKGGNDKA